MPNRASPPDDLGAETERAPRRPVAGEPASPAIPRGFDVNAAAARVRAMRESDTPPATAGPPAPAPAAPPERDPRERVAEPVAAARPESAVGATDRDLAVHAPPAAPPAAPPGEPQVAAVEPPLPRTVQEPPASVGFIVIPPRARRASRRARPIETAAASAEPPDRPEEAAASAAPASSSALDALQIDEEPPTLGPLRDALRGEAQEPPQPASHPASGEGGPDSDTEAPLLEVELEPVSLDEVPITEAGLLPGPDEGRPAPGATRAAAGLAADHPSETVLPARADASCAPPVADVEAAVTTAPPAPLAVVAPAVEAGPDVPPSAPELRTEAPGALAAWAPVVRGTVPAAPESTAAPPDGVTAVPDALAAELHTLLDETAATPDASSPAASDFRTAAPPSADAVPELLDALPIEISEEALEPVSELEARSDTAPAPALQGGAEPGPTDLCDAPVSEQAFAEPDLAATEPAAEVSDLDLLSPEELAGAAPAAEAVDVPAPVVSKGARAPSYTLEDYGLDPADPSSAAWAAWYAEQGWDPATAYAHARQLEAQQAARAPAPADPAPSEGEPALPFPLPGDAALAEATAELRADHAWSSEPSSGPATAADPEVVVDVEEAPASTSPQAGEIAWTRAWSDADGAAGRASSPARDLASELFPDVSGEPAIPASEPPLAASAALVAGSHRVVLHTTDGLVRRGVLTDCLLDGAEIALSAQDGQPEAVAVDQVKAIFFMLPAGTPPSKPRGEKVRVTFRDGRQVAGYTEDYAPGGLGFFMVPADARTHTARIWIYQSAVRQVVAS